jgi:hypothetical protein
MAILKGLKFPSLNTERFAVFGFVDLRITQWVD